VDLSSATAAAIAIASSLGLDADSSVVLHNSNKLTLRLVPCDVVARVSAGPRRAAQFEVDLARQLVAASCPVAALEPGGGAQVYQRDGLNVTFWTSYPTVAREITPTVYAHSLERLHAGMRTVAAATPHFMDRVEEA
jgi:hypothetical protein